MKHIRMAAYLICTVLAAAFLAACSGMETGGADSDHSNHSGGHNH